MGIDSCLLIKAAPISASAANDMTLLIVFNRVWMVLLRGLLVLGPRSGLGEQLLRI